MTELPESAKNRALRILERRDVSRKELVRKLTEKAKAVKTPSRWPIGCAV